MSTEPGTPKPVITAQQRAQVAELAGQGVSRNAIAVRLGISNGSVSKIAAEAGVSFDRTATKAATAAAKADNASRRASLSSLLLTKAAALLDEMDEPFLAFNIGGKDNVYTEHQLDAAPTVDKKNLMTAASIALQRHLDIERHDADQSAGDVRNMLADLGRALGVQGPDDTP